MNEEMLQELEGKIRQIFEENFELIRAEGGHSITDFLKEEAFNQILCYLRKNRALIERITEAEVKLTLAGQKTPGTGRSYAIEGVVDIIREGEDVWMYDLKTHERSAIEANKEFYREQLNVYAFIWKNLMGRALDDTAIISTALPDKLKSAMRAGDQEAAARSMVDWEPVIPLGYSEEEVEAMIDRFGQIVDKIEDHRFAPPSVDRLFEKEPSGGQAFAVRTCRNCDVRFSCSAFREYATGSGSRKMGFRQYFDDYGTDFEPEDYIEGNLADIKE